MQTYFCGFSLCLSAPPALKRLQILRNRDVSSVEVACCIDLHIDGGWKAWDISPSSASCVIMLCTATHDRRIK